MTITLTPEMELFVERKVKSGRYNSANEVVCKALEQLDEQDRLDQEWLEEVRAKIIEGEEDFNNGRFISVSNEAESRALLERIIRRGNERLATRKAK